MIAWHREEWDKQRDRDSRSGEVEWRRKEKRQKKTKFEIGYLSFHISWKKIHENGKPNIWANSRIN